MRHLFRFISFSLLLTIVFSACKKDENQIFYLGGKSPVLAVSIASPLVLDINNKNSPAITFSWTNPDYQLTTGLSSQDVLYVLQIDTANGGFKSSKLQEIAISKDLSKMFTTKEFNTLLVALGVAENVAKPLDIRIKSSLINSSAILYSNTAKLTVTPYLDVIYPVPSALYITGAASPLNWQCGCGSDGPGTSQKFTQTSATTFELTVILNGGQSYLLLPAYGSWSAKYGGAGSSNNSNNVAGDDFKPNGSDLLSPPLTKSYKITVEFKTGKFTVQ